MKNILLVLTLFSLTLHAQDVVVVSASVVTVDGAVSGKPADTIRNRPELASAIQLALEEREAQLASALAVVQANLAAALAANVTLVAKLQAAKSLVEFNVIRTEAGVPEIVLRRAKLAAELAAKQAELDAVK